MLVLAEHVNGEGHLFGWFVGLGIGFAIVLVVVVIVATILATASRISGQARAAIRALDQGRVNTLPLWDVAETNRSLKGIVTAAQAARKGLTT